jgi:hypothetical protein
VVVSRLRSVGGRWPAGEAVAVGIDAGDILLFELVGLGKPGAGFAYGHNVRDEP